MALFRLLTFPVSGPVVGVRWVLQTLLDEAERRYYDINEIRQQLDAAQHQFMLGEMDESAFERTEEALLQRLMEARDFHRSRADGFDG